MCFVCPSLESQQEHAGRRRRGRRGKIRQRQTDCEIRDEVLAFFAGLYQMSVTRTNTHGGFKLVPLFDLCEINVGFYATKSCRPAAQIIKCELARAAF